MKKYLIEFIGTFFLVLVVAMTGNPLAIGAFLVAMVYAGGPISGAHYNHAVTLAVHLVGKISRQEALKYIGTQFVAAIAAAAVYFSLHQTLFLPHPAVQTSFVTAFLIELLFTFLLVHTIL